MQKLSNPIKILFIFILISILSLSTIVFADEIEEETDYIWLQEEISNASTNASNEPNLNSRYIAVLDRDSKAIIYGKSENTRVPMASTTKIMTAIVLCEYIEGNKDISFDNEIEVCKQAASIGGSRLGLKTGDKITINNLLYGLMLCSRK